MSINYVAILKDLASVASAAKVAGGALLHRAYQWLAAKWKAAKAEAAALEAKAAAEAKKL
jgi:hypothetical protein